MIQKKKSSDFRGYFGANGSGESGIHTFRSQRLIQEIALKTQPECLWQFETSLLTGCSTVPRHNFTDERTTDIWHNVLVRKLFTPHKSDMNIWTKKLSSVVTAWEDKRKKTIEHLQMITSIVHNFFFSGPTGLSTGEHVESLDWLEEGWECLGRLLQDSQERPQRRFNARMHARGHARDHTGQQGAKERTQSTSAI